MTKHADEKTVQVFDVVIIGAGLSGTLAALELPRDIKIALVDIGEEILPSKSSSYNQCNRLHIGLHYAGDVDTAQKCLQDSLEFAKKFRPFILGKADQPWRKGRYFIMSNSLFGAEKIQNLCLLIANIYAKKAKEYKYVFGKPNDFIKFIEPHQYPEVAKTIPFINEEGKEINIAVSLGVETNESQIDIDLFKKFLNKKIKERRNIVFMPYNQANQIIFNNKELLYNISITDINTNLRKSIQGQSVVNCTWQNTELLDGIDSMNKPERLIRVKASILVKLPDELLNMNTCIFSIGPYCSLTNLGNGLAIVTEETVSNVGHYIVGDKPSNDIDSLTKSENPLQHPLGKEIATKMLLKSSHFIPGLKNADILKLRLGYVKILTKGLDYSLYSALSPIHLRKDGGVEQIGIGHISVSGMKMSYTYKNALSVKKLLRKHERVKKLLLEILKEPPGIILDELNSFSANSKILPESSWANIIRSYLSKKLRLKLNELEQILPTKQLIAVLEAHALIPKKKNNVKEKKSKTLKEKYLPSMPIIINETKVLLDE